MTKLWAVGIYYQNSIGQCVSATWVIAPTQADAEASTRRRCTIQKTNPESVFYMGWSFICSAEEIPLKEVLPLMELADNPALVKIVEEITK